MNRQSEGIAPSMPWHSGTDGAVPSGCFGSDRMRPYRLIYRMVGTDSTRSLIWPDKRGRGGTRPYRVRGPHAL